MSAKPARPKPTSILIADDPLPFPEMWARAVRSKNGVLKRLRNKGLVGYKLQELELMCWHAMTRMWIKGQDPAYAPYWTCKGPVIIRPTFGQCEIVHRVTPLSELIEAEFWEEVLGVSEELAPACRRRAFGEQQEDFDQNDLDCSDARMLDHYGRFPHFERTGWIHRPKWTSNLCWTTFLKPDTVDPKPRPPKARTFRHAIGAAIRMLWDRPAWTAALDSSGHTDRAFAKALEWLYRSGIAVRRNVRSRVCWSIRPEVRGEGSKCRSVPYAITVGQMLKTGWDRAFMTGQRAWDIGTDEERNIVYVSEAGGVYFPSGRVADSDSVFLLTPEIDARANGNRVERLPIGYWRGKAREVRRAIGTVHPHVGGE